MYSWCCCIAAVLAAGTDYDVTKHWNVEGLTSDIDIAVYCSAAQLSSGKPARPRSPAAHRLAPERVESRHLPQLLFRLVCYCLRSVQSDRMAERRDDEKIVKMELVPHEKCSEEGA